MFRIILKILLGLLVIIGIALFWALEMVDYTPYFKTDYYTSTRNRLDSISDLLTVEEGLLEIGLAKVSITPTINAKQEQPAKGIFGQVPLAGFGDRKGKPAEGVHDSIYVKAVALKVDDNLLVLVGSDLLIMPPAVSEGALQLVKNQAGILRSQVFFSATHTHSSLGAWSEGLVGEQFAGQANPELVNWLAHQVSQAILKSVHDLQPGKIGTAKFEAADFVRNRLVGELGTKDPDFIFIKVQQNTGKNAILGSFDAHATTLGGWNMQVSADYPGYWQRKLESQSVDLAVFFAGSVGSHSAASKGEKFDKPRFIGEALADSVTKYSATLPLSDRFSLGAMTLKMDLPDLHIRVTDGLRMNPILGRKLFPPIGDAYVQVARIGNLIWATAPCDFSGELAKLLKNEMGRSGYNVLVTSFNGAYVGYIIPGKYYHLNGYEPRVMSWFGPYMGPYTYEMIDRMMERVAVQ